AASSSHVRFSPRADKPAQLSPCPLRAKSGHLQRKKLFDHLVGVSTPSALAVVGPEPSHLMRCGVLSVNIVLWGPRDAFTSCPSCVVALATLAVLRPIVVQPPSANPIVAALAKDPVTTDYRS